VTRLLLTVAAGVVVAAGSDWLSPTRSVVVFRYDSARTRHDLKTSSQS
jgi:hypothetical protein